MIMLSKKMTFIQYDLYTTCFSNFRIKMESMLKVKQYLYINACFSSKF
jgi:hypothetical protein